MITWATLGVEMTNKGLLRNWKGNIEAETKPADNLDQLKYIGSLQN